MIVVQVRTADAAGGDLDAHFAGTRRRIGKAVDPQVFRGMNDDGTHDLVLLFRLHRRQHSAVDINALPVAVFQCPSSPDHPPPPTPPPPPPPPQGAPVI